MFKQLNENFSDDPEEEIDQVIKSLQELNNDSWNLIKSFSLLVLRTCDKIISASILWEIMFLFFKIFDPMFIASDVFILSKTF